MTKMTIRGHFNNSACEELHGLRFCGARLVAGATGWRLVPGDEIDRGRWADWRRRWLLPRLATLTRLLGGLG